MRRYIQSFDQSSCMPIEIPSIQSDMTVYYKLQRIEDWSFCGQMYIIPASERAAGKKFHLIRIYPDIWLAFPTELGI